ncbi:uncharacterized protein LOC114728332 isoform X2 [Neltuma alba]|uniref:uncharacterized protein LOC114728332 isoform X2 n=1 Tax=Neltuma alba TaxID=207710 RepID=UPI0010A389BA|nr:uncharacterized protein LOC114728332 isoform X2 [Prosopis alba]
MGWQRWNQKANDLLGSASPMQVFHLFTLTILSLLLPTSFLLLARLSASQYYLQSTASFPSPCPSLHLYSLLLHINPNVLYLLVSIVSVATLIHGLTCKFSFFAQSSTSLLKLPLHASWILLCSFQVCVGLGIKGNIATDVYDSDPSFGLRRSFFSKLIFLLGLHETTQVWSRTVVKPVVDDSMLGNSRKERWVERVAVAASLGGLWWWRLREEVETLMVMAEAKTEQLMDMEMRDFVGWWLYYLTVTIGMVRILKGLLWIAMICVCRRRVTESSLAGPNENDDKV